MCVDLLTNDSVRFLFQRATISIFVCLFCENRLKAHLEAAEERGDELQRLLDASRASEAQAKCQLRSFQQQLHQRSSSSSSSDISPPEVNSTSTEQQQPKEELVTVCHGLVDDLAQVEERLHQMESDWMEEKRKRIQLEAQLVQLEKEQETRIDSANATAMAMQSCHHYSLPHPSSSAMIHLKTDRSLSLSEELISADFASGQWRDAWDDSHGPLSLIGSVVNHRLNHHHHHHHLALNKDEEESGSSDSSSSGFSDENHARSSASKATQTEGLVAIVKPPTAVSLSTPPTDAADYKTLFQQIFAVIQQNK